MNAPQKHSGPDQPSILKIVLEAAEPQIQLLKDFRTRLAALLSYISDERTQYLFKLQYGDRPSQLQAAKRLAQLMRPPRLDRVTKATAESKAKELGMSVERYFREAIYPDALLRAASKIVLPQMAPRLGRYNWVVNEAGKRGTTTAEHLYDNEAVHWLYQEATKACRAIVMEQPSDEDAFYRAVEDADGNFTEKVLIAKSLQEVNPLEDELLAAESRDRAKWLVGALKQHVSAKDRALLNEAVSRDGDLMSVLLENGYTPKTAHKMRERWRNALK